MRIVISFFLLFCLNLAKASTFPERTRLCTYILEDGGEKFLMFNFKTRSQVVIKLSGKDLGKLTRGPYLLDLKVLNPEHKKSEYRAEILSVGSCDPARVVRIVDGELKGKK